MQVCSAPWSWRVMQPIVVRKRLGPQRPALLPNYQTHPQSQHTESHNRNLLSNALHLAHDRIHILVLLKGKNCGCLAGWAASRRPA